MSNPKLTPGSNRCLCSGCGEHFNSVAAFDMHRIGKGRDRRCERPEAVGMVKNGAGFWITGKMPLKPAGFGGTKREKQAIA